MSPEEHEQGVTFEELRERYTGKICVTVNYEVGYVGISAPPNNRVPGGYVLVRNPEHLLRRQELTHEAGSVRQ